MENDFYVKNRGRRGLSSYTPFTSTPIPNQFVVLLRQSNKTPQYRTWYRKLISFLKALLSRFLQLLVWLLKTWRYRLQRTLDSITFNSICDFDYPRIPLQSLASFMLQTDLGETWGDTFASRGLCG